MTSIPGSAKIVIIGGGIVGLFTAWELASRGEKDIVILERRTFLGAGSTQKAAGGFRTQFTTPGNVAFSKYSVDFYKYRFPKELNEYFKIIQNGYLLFARTESKLAALDQSLALQKKCGVENVRRVGAEEIKAMLPELDVSQVLGGNYSPDDGWLDPGDIIRGLDDSVRAMKIPIFTDIEVTEVIPKSDFSHDVVTGEGTIHAKQVLFATGAWSGKLTDKLGVDIHMQPVRHTLWVTAPLDWYPKSAPFTFDILTTAHMRAESGGVMFGHDNHDEKPSYSEDADMDFFYKIIPNFLEIMPRLEEAEIANAWGGLYAVSDDHSAILGAIPGHRGLWIATGFSGHGVMHAPATCCSMAEFLLDGKTSTLDVSMFRMERFVEGDLIRETAVF